MISSSFAILYVRQSGGITGRRKAQFGLKVESSWKRGESGVPRVLITQPYQTFETPQKYSKNTINHGADPDN
jgi:hypothetical protein